MQINIYVKRKLLHRTQSYFLISTINDCRGIRNDALINNYKDAQSLAVCRQYRATRPPGRVLNPRSSCVTIPQTTRTAPCRPNTQALNYNKINQCPLADLGGSISARGFGPGPNLGGSKSPWTPVPGTRLLMKNLVSQSPSIRILTTS